MKGMDSLEKVNELLPLVQPQDFRDTKERVQFYAAIAQAEAMVRVAEALEKLAGCVGEGTYREGLLNVYVCRDGEL